MTQKPPFSMAIQTAMDTVIQGDCLEILPTLPDNSVDLIVTDPPYFKVKKGSTGINSWWDNQWDKPAEFLKWLDNIAEQWQRILKPNGSLYCFASPKMSARVEVMLADRFNVLNRVNWIKPEPTCEINQGASNGGRVCKETLRSFYPNTESIIFCEHYGSDSAAKGESGWGEKCGELRGFVFEPLRKWFENEKNKAGIITRDINRAIGLADHAVGWKYTAKMQYQLPTIEHYTKLQQAFPGYFTRPYEELRQQYEELRQQYEELRRPFTVSAEVPYTDVWTFPTVQAYPGKHPCEKPLSLLSHIINASSRPGAVVLDCFAGSGATLVAAKQLDRRFIGIEIDPHWVNVAQQRLGQFERSLTLEERVQWLETQVKANTKKIKSIEDKTCQQLTLWNVNGGAA